MNKYTIIANNTAVADSRHFIKKHPLLLPVIIFIMLFFMGLAMLVSLGGQTVGASDKRIVQLFYDGKDQTVPNTRKICRRTIAKT